MLILLSNASLFVGLLQNGYIIKTSGVSCNVDELYLNFYLFSVYLVGTKRAVSVILLLLPCLH